MRVRGAMRILGVGLLVAVLTLPALWLVVSSFKNRVDLMRNPPQFIFQPTVEHYQRAFGERGFLADLANSFLVAAGSSLLAVGLAYPAALGLAGLSNPLRNHLLFFVLSTRLVPPVALGLPLYLLYRDLRLLDTLGGLILAHSAFNLSFAVWMVTAFLARLDEEIFEAAEVDGLGLWRLGRTLLPALVAPLAMVALFCFVFSWNEFFLGSVLTSGDARTLPVAILGLVTSQGTYWGQFCAVASVTLVPVVVFAIVLRRSAGALLSFGGVEVKER